ncbi:type I restriction-modification system subunit M [Corynebacterium pelargi]|uniref:site-specific DNA-methyltransferase (adenine-specific) n=1 Tax=Corynebacterium pelargi TaxID=1471400 RepID=A0A410WAQ5_9CORY|nr:type I restriction-modification system subunit M [Corynebacterium pelargi]QAU53006.1 Type I restriction enzyme EcoKI M protein [Corynebacterium pelargi]GGG75485.1 type I restriction-modification system subunit M [Corynebacterium pelargi]
MNKQQLASQIWKAANKMRGSLDANDYKDLILGLMFYKYLSTREVEFFVSNGLPIESLEVHLNGENERRVAQAQDQLGYFIEHQDLFSTWEDDLNELRPSKVIEATQAFDAKVNPAYKSIFHEIFSPLAAAVPKLGTDATAQGKKLRELIRIVRDIPTGSRQDYDVLGYVYEYLISHFAANAGKSAGEFYTPHQVSLVMAEIVGHHLKGRDSIQVYDPTSGSASLLLNIGEAITRRSGNPDSIQYYAQELKKAAYSLTRMNLVMRDIKPANIVTREGDSLGADWPMIDPHTNEYHPLFVDAVVSNPPYSAEWERPKTGSDPRFAYGLAPEKTADYAFLLHELYHLKDDGILAIVLPHGVLFRGGEEASIRTQLVERNHIDAIIGLPANIFYGTGIATIIMILKKQRDDDSILFVDASKGFSKMGKKNELRHRDIRKIVDTVTERRSEDKYSRLVSKHEIKDNHYNLNIPRYVDSSEPAETWDIYATMFGGIPQTEIDALSTYWDALPGLRETVFTSTTETHARVREDLHSKNQLVEAVRQHPSTQAFMRDYVQAFAGWDEILGDTLVEGLNEVNMTTIEGELRNQLFERLQQVPIVDDYTVYQIFADHWFTTNRDLEVLKGQGWGTIRQVEPNMVLKKKDGKNTEVQDGWLGTILPFGLVQKELLTKDFEELSIMEVRLAEAQERVAELFDSLSEEQLGSGDTSITNAAGDAFAVGGVKDRLAPLLEDITSPEIDVLSEYLETKGAAKKRIITAHPEVDWASMTPNKSGTYTDTVVRKRIEDLRRASDFAEGAIEPVLIEALDLLDEVKEAKKAITDREAKIHLETKNLIETLDDETAKRLLRMKWVRGMLTDIESVPTQTINELIDEIEHLDAKYATTLSDIGKRANEAQTNLAEMMGRLTGPQRDMEGIHELATILSGEQA